MAIGETNVWARIRAGEAPHPASSQSAGSDGGSRDTDVLYPPGIKLFGEEKRQRDRLIREEVARHVDPATGRLPASEAQRVYTEVGRRYGLSPSGVILRTPANIKPTNLETLEFARSQKGKRPPGERSTRSRRRRGAGSEAAPHEERRKKRSPEVAGLVRQAAMEFVDTQTGRIPASRATEVYRILSERFERTPGTVSNYLKGLTPTAQECANLRWERDRMRRQGAASPGGTQGEADYTSHPAALFPVQKQAPPPRPPGPRTLKEREAPLRSADGRLIDYDESYQRRRQGETLETKLDDATQEFLRTFRLQQATEFIDALRDCGRAMSHYTIQTQRQLQEFHAGLEAAGNRIMGATEQTIQQMKQHHAREMEELRAAKDRQIRELNNRIAALEEENERALAKVREVASILGGTGEAAR